MQAVRSKNRIGIKYNIFFLHGNVPKVLFCIAVIELKALLELKLSGASSGESSIPKEGILSMIRSLTPQQAARNALAAEFNYLIQQQGHLSAV
jgi:hypothetical protein